MSPYLSSCATFVVSALMAAALAPAAVAMDGSQGITSVTDAAPSSDVGLKIVADKDLEFINRAASAGAYEVESSKYVISRGLTGDAKAFAQNMAADHFVVANRLHDLLLKKGIAMPQRMTFDDRVAMSKLKDTREDQLGKAYADMQVKEHIAAIALYTDEAANGTDAELKAFAQSNLPQLQKNLEHAQMVAGVGTVQ